MTYWFKPYTHWHEITPETWDVLLGAGYQPDRLRRTTGEMPS